MLLVGLAVLAATAGGCSMFCPKPGALQDIGCGRVMLRWPSCRHLQVVEHTCRRDRLNHLVARVRFNNVSASPYVAEVRVEFRDRAGTREEGWDKVDRQEFTPGTSNPIEWTSRSDTAVSYVVEVGRASAFAWW